jgi:hypothetical protein
MLRELLVLYFHLLRNETHAAFHTSFSTIVERIGPGSLGITAAYTEVYKLVFAEELALLDIILKSPLTAQIAAQDGVRDDILRGLIALVEAATHDLDPVVRAAGERLKEIISHYGSFGRRSYNDETAAIDDVVREFETAVNKALVTAIGATTRVAQLKAANKRFIELMDARYAEVGQRTNQRMRELRAATDKALQAILERIEAQIILYGMTSSSSDYKPFVEAYNALVKSYKNILAMEKGHRKKEEEEL